MQVKVKLLNIRLFWASVFLMSVAFAPVSAQFCAYNYSTDKGLSQKSAYALFYDRKGYLWVGTQIGLNRFDGTVFKVYNHEPGEDGLANGHVFSLYGDSQDRMWIGTSIGLSLYVPEKDSFLNWSVPGLSCSIYDIVEISGKDRLLLATDKGLAVFDISIGSMDMLESLRNTEILCVTKCREDILVGTSSGMYLFDPESETAERIVPELASERISDMVWSDATGEVWAGTFGSGLFRMDEEFSVKKQYRGGGLKSDYVRTVCHDPEGRILVGTLKGVSVSDGDVFRPALFVDNKGGSLENESSVRSIIMGPSGEIWIGTFDDGIFFCAEEEPLFRVQEFYPGGDAGPHISGIAEIPDSHDILIADYNEGLFLYDRKTRKTSRVRTGPADHELILARDLMAVSAETVYVGTYLNGLLCADLSSGDVRQFCIGKPSSESNSCYAVLDLEDGRLLLGGIRGLYIFDTAARKISRYVPEGSDGDLNEALVSELFSDSSGNIWALTGKTVWKLDSDGHAGRIMFDGQDIPGYGIFETRNGDIWISSSDGLFRFMAGAGMPELYTTKDGLPSLSLSGINEDSRGNVWINTNKGIASFNPVLETFTLYTASDGVSVNKFEEKGFCRTHDGMFVACGQGGLNIFDPDRLNVSTNQSVPLIPDCIVEGQSVSDHPELFDVEYDQDGELSRFSCSSSSSGFTFLFSAINHVQKGRISWSYMMEGVDKRWNRTASPVASYANLKPGHYTFLLRTLNVNGVLSDTTARIDMEIRPSWYQTLFFKITAFTVALMIVLVLAKLYADNIRNRNMLYIKKQLLSPLAVETENVTGGPQMNPADREFVDKVVKIIEENIKNADFSTDDLAGLLYMGRSSLYTKMNEVCGETPANFIRKVRIDKACSYLLEGRYRISEISEMVGFKTSSYFTSCFKKYKGCLPKDYVKGVIDGM